MHDDEDDVRRDHRGHSEPSDSASSGSDDSGSSFERAEAAALLPAVAVPRSPAVSSASDDLDAVIRNTPFLVALDNSATAGRDATADSDCAFISARLWDGGVRSLPSCASQPLFG